MKKVKEIASHTYTKWQLTEDSDTVFNLIKDGKMNKLGFENWLNQVCVEEYRSATADESM